MGRAQYAQRLRLHKRQLPHEPAEIAQGLVREYKDHGFVIDLPKAMEHPGTEWVRTGTKEVELGDRLPGP